MPFFEVRLIWPAKADKMFEDAKTGFMILFLWCPFKNFKTSKITYKRVYHYGCLDGLDPLLYI